MCIFKNWLYHSVIISMQTNARTNERTNERIEMMSIDSCDIGYSSFKFPYGRCELHFFFVVVLFFLSFQMIQFIFFHFCIHELMLIITFVAMTTESFEFTRI